MTSNAFSIAKDYERLKTACLLDPDQILFNNISKVLHLRKEIALKIIGEDMNEKNIKNLRGAYESLNENLRQLLGL